MKWIGQHIWDLISRFRSDVYLESIADHGSDPDRFLTMDSTTGKVSTELVVRLLQILERLP